MKRTENKLATWLLGIATALYIGLVGLFIFVVTHFVMKFW